MIFRFLSVLFLVLVSHVAAVNGYTAFLLEDGDTYTVDRLVESIRKNSRRLPSHPVEERRTLAGTLSDTLDDLEEFRGGFVLSDSSPDDLLVALLEVLDLRKAGMNFQANVHEPIVVGKIGKYLQSVGKLTDPLARIVERETGEPS